MSKVKGSRKNCTSGQVEGAPLVRMPLRRDDPILNPENIASTSTGTTTDKFSQGMMRVGTCVHSGSSTSGYYSKKMRRNRDNLVPLSTEGNPVPTKTGINPVATRRQRKLAERTQIQKCVYVACDQEMRLNDFTSGLLASGSCDDFARSVDIMTEKVLIYYQKYPQELTILRKGHIDNNLPINNTIILVNKMLQKIFQKFQPITKKNYFEALSKYLNLLHFPSKITPDVLRSVDTKNWALVVGILHWLSQLHNYMVNTEADMQGRLFIAHPTETRKGEEEYKSWNLQNQLAGVIKVWRTIIEKSGSEDGLKEYVTIIDRRRKEVFLAQRSKKIIKDLNQELGKLLGRKRMFQANLTRQRESMKKLKDLISEIKLSCFDLSTTSMEYEAEINKQKEMGNENEYLELYSKSEQNQSETDGGIKSKINQLKYEIRKKVLLFNIDVRSGSSNCPFLEEFVLDPAKITKLSFSKDISHIINEVLDRQIKLEIECREKEMMITEFLKRDHAQYIQATQTMQNIRMYEERELQRLVQAESAHKNLGNMELAHNARISLCLKEITHLKLIRPTHDSLTKSFLERLTRLLNYYNTYKNESQYNSELIRMIEQELADDLQNYQRLKQRILLDIKLYGQKLT